MPAAGAVVEVGQARRSLVTGAASGIGRALVAALAGTGDRVLATDIDSDALERTAADDGWSPQIERLRLDVREAAGWDTAVAEAERLWGGLDVVANVAGMLRPAELHAVTDADIELHLDVNVRGVVLGSRAAARHMRPRGTGHIVNVASLAGMAPIPGISLYSASKYAVRGFSLAIADELRPHGVAVTVLCPDAVRTPMLDLQVDYPEAALTFTAPRFLDADDIADMIVDRILPRRPLLVAVPRSRGLLARFADCFPAAQRPLAGLLRRFGRRRQRTFERDRPTGDRGRRD
ncbi:MAG: SDR family oxidoreductase [Acidobacteriota bacterium]